MFHRTWVITIYRQTLLPGLDFADMTYTGVLATILSGLEPAVAIALACIPLLRPLYKSRTTEISLSRYYGSSEASEFLSKKGSKYNNRPFDALDDEIQLQPVQPIHNVKVTATVDTGSKNLLAMTKPNAITIDTRWEVRAD